MVTELKVAATSRSTAVAGAIAGAIREKQPVAVRAIGAGAANQAIKAIIIARHYLEEDGVDLVCVPIFEVIDLEGIERTAIKLSLESRPLTSTPQEHNGSG